MPWWKILLLETTRSTRGASGTAGITASGRWPSRTSIQPKAWSSSRSTYLRAHLPSSASYWTQPTATVHVLDAVPQEGFLDAARWALRISQQLTKPWRLQADTSREEFPPVLNFRSWSPVIDAILATGRSMPMWFIFYLNFGEFHL